MITHMGFLYELLLGDLPHAAEMGAVTAGWRCHTSPTNLRDKEKTEMDDLIHSFYCNCFSFFPAPFFSLKNAGLLVLKECLSTTCPAGDSAIGRTNKPNSRATVIWFITTQQKLFHASITDKFLVILKEAPHHTSTVDNSWWTGVVWAPTPYTVSVLMTQNKRLRHK